MIPRELPIESEVESASPLQRRSASRWPRLDPGVLVAVFLGGVLGGLARYGIGLVAPEARGSFPWGIFAINIGGAFGLALLLVLVLDVIRPTRYVRPALGTGFMGAFTTFSSLAVATDQLIADGHLALAASYVVGSLVGGLAAASSGLVVGRAISASRHGARQRGVV